MLTTASSVHYLGVTIDPTLSWNSHASDVVSKVQSRVASILRFGTLSPVILCSLYTAFVLTLFYYCDVVWCSTTTKFTSVIERVHAKFVKKLPPSCAAGLSFTLTER